MDKIKLKYPYAKSKSFLKEQLELIQLYFLTYFFPNLFFLKPSSHKSQTNTTIYWLLNKCKI